MSNGLGTNFQNDRPGFIHCRCGLLGGGLYSQENSQVKDWTIIYIVTAIAVLLTVWMLGFGPESIIQGVLCGAFAVYGHQAVKQMKKGGEK